MWEPVAYDDVAASIDANLLSVDDVYAFITPNAKESLSVDEVIYPKSPICWDDDIVPAGITETLNPDAAAEAEMYVGLI